MHHLQNINYLCEYVRSFGLLAPLAAIGLFILQSVVPVFPYSVLVAVAVVLFGGPEGTGIALVGALLGSVICYKISLGRGGVWFSDQVASLLGYENIRTGPGMAFSGIVLAHWVQIVPNALINFTAALSGVPLLNFAMSSALGLIPVTLAYAGVGILVAHMHGLIEILLVITAISLILYWCKNVIKRSWPGITKLTARYGGGAVKEALSIEESQA